MNNIALFDMDGTLCNYDDALRRDLAKIAHPNDPPIPSVHSNLPDWLDNRIAMIRNQPKWWQNLEPLEQGIDLLKMCVEIGFQIKILTKGPKKAESAWTEKKKWCRCNLSDIAPDMEVTITEDKGIVYGKVLFDDWPKYMDAWLAHRPRGLGIMPAHAWNKDYNHPNVIRYDGSQREEVRERLVATFNRQPQA